MAAIDIIRRRLKEDRAPDVPDEIGEKKKRPREVAFMDVNLSEGGAHSVRHLGKGSRIREKMNAEERAILEQERRRA
ncbi:MAG: hypothetical protein HYZ72_14530 [Deltaproteobacteria bacterium]|nr:hypothetical protein [Deltaproteobacteria bacterium]